MFEIDDLKKNWQNQKPGELLNIKNSSTISGILPKLRKFEKKQFRINLFKTSGVTVMLLLLLFTFNVFSVFSFFKVLGIAWIIISTVVFLIMYWRRQFRMKKFNMQESSLTFIQDTLDNFEGQKILFKDKFWKFGISIIAGLNILYLDILKSLPLTERLGMHIIMSIIITAVIYGGIKFRMFRFKKEYQPIINELEKMKEDLGDVKWS